MDSKLTLKLDKQVIERAKAYARYTNTSLSKLIENYLSALTTESSKEDDINPITESLTGIIKLQDNKDFKKEYTSYLNEKYR